MSWIKWILACVFGCVHRRTTWPHHDRRGFDYVCCLECGKELPYSTQQMRIMTGKVLMADRNVRGWDKLGNVQLEADTGFAPEHASRFDCTQALRAFGSCHLPTKDMLSLRKAESAIGSLLQRTCVAGIVILYSKNVFSATVRVLISF